MWEISLIFVRENELVDSYSVDICVSLTSTWFSQMEERGLMWKPSSLDFSSLKACVKLTFNELAKGYVGHSLLSARFQLPWKWRGVIFQYSLGESGCSWVQLVIDGVRDSRLRDPGDHLSCVSRKSCGPFQNPDFWSCKAIFSKPIPPDPLLGWILRGEGRLFFWVCFVSFVYGIHVLMQYGSMGNITLALYSKLL